LLNWTIEKLVLPLKFTWKLSRNATDQKINFFIKVNAGKYTGIGEVAPNIRYHETPEKVLSEFAMVLNNELSIVRNYEDLRKLLSQFKISNALKFGIKSAYIDWLCKSERISVYDYLGTKKPDFVHTAFTVPIMPVHKLSDFFLKNDLHRFKYIKVKVDKNTGLDTVKEIHNITDQALMIDANEDWKDTDELLWFLDNIKNYKIEFVEQPMPAFMEQAYIDIREKSPLPLFADESFTNNPDFMLIKRQFHGVNIKLMKAGGVKNGVRLLKEAKLFGLKTMIGCMVETSVGISNGMYLAGETDYVDLDSFLYLESDPGKRLKEEGGFIISNNF
jgi:L-alanine-DL-glutamate epimerase-like enolase superfamily enzyme